MNYQDQILAFLLPNKSSRLIAELSITLGTAAIFLPEFLKMLCIKLSDHITLLIRIATPLLLWLLGSLIVLLIVVQHYKKQKSQKQPQVPMPILAKKPAVFPKEQVDILLCILEKVGDTLTFEIVQSLNISEHIVKYHLQELYKKQLISEGLPILPGQQSWSITDKGTKYLIENKLIS